MFKYEEDIILDEIKQYIESTYQQHYVSENETQLIDIVDKEDLEGFARINAMKYVQRYGKKDGANRKDLFKAVHYIIMMIRIDNERRTKK
jgi:hypothetical protein